MTDLQGFSDCTLPDTGFVGLLVGGGAMAIVDMLLDIWLMGVSIAIASACI